MLRLLWVFLVVVLCASLIGCGGNGPEAVTRQFIDANSRDDKAGAEALVTKLARQNAQADNGKTFRITKKDPATGAETKWNDCTVGSATIEGDNAVVPVTKKQDGKEQVVKFKLRKEDGAWRIFALVVPISPGNEITLDLEHPETMFAEMFKALKPAMEQGAKALGDGLKSLGDGLSKVGDGLKQNPQPNSQPR